MSITDVSIIGVPVTGVSITGASITGESGTGVSVMGVSITGVFVTGVSITGVSVCKNHKKVVDETTEGEDAKYCPRSLSLEGVLSATVEHSSAQCWPLRFLALTLSSCACKASGGQARMTAAMSPFRISLTFVACFLHVA